MIQNKEYKVSKTKINEYSLYCINTTKTAGASEPIFNLLNAGIMNLVKPVNWGGDQAAVDQRTFSTHWNFFFFKSRPDKYL